jgi:hypothetical protein
MLRRAVIGLGALLMLAGLVVSLATRSAAGLGPAGFGAVLLLAILFERRHYKRIEDSVPGPDWRPTGERFLDPVSDVPVAVYFHPPTGKRAYVRTDHP